MIKTAVREGREKKKERERVLASDERR